MEDETSERIRAYLSPLESLRESARLLQLSLDFLVDTANTDFQAGLSSLAGEYGYVLTRSNICIVLGQ